jgi:16S rRNA (guanine966-N2)-methyltransferase
LKKIMRAANQQKSAMPSGMIRLSSGFAKGLGVITPSGLDTRPTRSRVRAAAINMIQDFIDGASVADLFAGSGAVGIELVSRGAKGCTFVENSADVCRVLAQNMEALRARAKSQDLGVSLNMVKADLVSSRAGFEWGALGVPSQKNFDIIWSDPPYTLAAEFLKDGGARCRELLNAEGIFVFECAAVDVKMIDAFCEQKQWSYWKQRAYGVSLITVWKK